jgi:hypothetical protein
MKYSMVPYIKGYIVTEQLQMILLFDIAGIYIFSINLFIDYYVYPRGVKIECCCHLTRPPSLEGGMQAFRI